MRKLNFCCGVIQPEGWENLDIDDYGQQYIHDATKGLTMFKDNSFDLIVANHAISAFTCDELEKIILPEFYRVLKNDGVVRIIDMDIELAITHYDNGEEKYFYQDDKYDIQEKFCRYITWNSTRKSIHNGHVMVKLLDRAGFSAKESSYKKSNFFDFSTELDDRQPESYYVEGIK